MDCNDRELSVLITDDPGIENLNRTYRGIAAPTNVLSFSMQEGEAAHICPQLLGDIVISIETAEAEAKNAGIMTEERISQLMIHGILHLLGYDHEQGETQAAEMENKSLALLRMIEPNGELDFF